MMSQLFKLFDKETSFTSQRSVYEASADEVFRCVHPACTRASGCSAQHRAGSRNIFAPAVTQLLMLRCPAAWAQAGAFCQERSCSLGAGEESSSAPSSMWRSTYLKEC